MSSDEFGLAFHYRLIIDYKNNAEVALATNIVETEVAKQDQNGDE